MDYISRHSAPDSIRDFIFSNHIKKVYSLQGEPFIFDGFILGLCLRGKGRLKVDYKEYDLQTGTIMSLLPNHIVKLEKKSEDFEIEILFLSFDLLIEFPTPKGFNLFDAVRLVPCVQVSEEMVYHLFEYYTFIEKQYIEVDNVYREEIVKTLLYGLILEISAVYNRDGNTPGDLLPVRQEELSDNFFRLLMQHYKEYRTVAFYAGKLCLTPKYLSSAIKRITGKSALAWINEAVVTDAKVLLKTTDYTILQISEELNFANPSFFVQFFKQHTGMTPLKYRQS